MKRELKKFIRKIYFKYLATVNYHTVVLRGALNPEQQKYFDQHKHLLKDKNWKETINQKSDDKKILEIGFGNGSHLQYLADNFSAGYEIFGNELDKVSIYKFLTKIDKFNFKNINLICTDARTLVKNIKENNFDTIFVLFSDPWPRRRDFKRRLLNKEFLSKLLEKIKINGQIILATDIDSYQEQIENICKEISKKNKIKLETFYEGENLKHSEIFKTKFALIAKKEGRLSKIFVITALY